LAVALNLLVLSCDPTGGKLADQRELMVRTPMKSSSPLKISGACCGWHFDRQRGALPSPTGSPRHRGTLLSSCFRHSSSPLFLDVRGGAALALPSTQDRVGMIRGTGIAN